MKCTKNSRTTRSFRKCWARWEVEAAPEEVAVAAAADLEARAAVTQEGVVAVVVVPGMVPGQGPGQIQDPDPDQDSVAEVEAEVVAVKGAAVGLAPAHHRGHHHKSDGGPVVHRGHTIAALLPPQPHSSLPHQTSHCHKQHAPRANVVPTQIGLTVTAQTVTDYLGGTVRPDRTIMTDRQDLDLTVKNSDAFLDNALSKMTSVEEALSAAAGTQVLNWLRERAKQTSLQVKDPLVLFCAQDLPILPATIPVAHRLRLAQASWRHVATPLVAQVISEGFRLQMTRPPEKRSQPPLSQELSQVVDSLITDYIGEGALTTVNGNKGQVALSPIFVVPKIPTGHRLIHDLRTVNDRIRTPAATKYDSVATFLYQVKRGDYFVRYDVKHAFLHKSSHHHGTARESLTSTDRDIQTM